MEEKFICMLFIGILFLSLVSAEIVIVKPSAGAGDGSGSTGNPFNQSLNTTDGVTFKNITIGTTDVNQYIQFFDSGSSEFLFWDTAANNFEFSDGLDMNGDLDINNGGGITAEGTIVGASTIRAFQSIYAGGNIYTTGVGDDLWLGTSTQADALFQANADGTVNATEIVSQGNIYSNGFQVLSYNRTVDGIDVTMTAVI